ncbi:MAG TPA: LysM peptidoglycan-binding domain-containing protein, partial [Anaerolineae bacterium]|nr:LysM peptidoglycan-binding domain-containing protein [Anaerolineae bacterium]
MQDDPQLSPDLRPIRYCPHCGERVAQRAETCFMCGGSLVPAKKRRPTLPISDLLLVGVVLIIAFLWWTRSSTGNDQPGDNQPAATAPAAAAAIPTGSVTPTVALTVTAEISGTTALTSTDDLTPTATPTPVIYTVVSGDTVEKIALAFGVSVTDLMAANGMSSDLIRVDQKLTIPSGPVELGADGRPLPTVTPTPKNA